MSNYADQDAVGRFGTDAFYASIGRAFVAMCAVVPLLFVIEALDVFLRLGLDYSLGILPYHVEGLDGIVFAHFLHADWIISTATASR